ncbi:MAG: hypothetical protein N4A76_01345 [Firmicutes bacterium]|jgi:hypothetical protein|nr:hypothetical protein [Bacillota bacterium]
MKKTITAITLIVIAVLTLPFPHKIKQTYPAIEYRIGYPDYIDRELTITVKGVYKDYLIKKDTFEGIVSVDKYDFTQDTLMSKVTIFDGKGNLSYFNMETLGFIIPEKDFSKFFIGVSEPIAEPGQSWSGGDGLVIAAPASTREEAIEITKELAKKSQWLSQSDWVE